MKRNSYHIFIIYCLFVSFYVILLSGNKKLSIIIRIKIIHFVYINKFIYIQNIITPSKK